MKKSYFIVTLLLLLLLSVLCSMHAQKVVLQGGKGDEQGLEVPKSLILKQDKDAFADAMKTWYKDDLKKHPHRADWFEAAKFGCFIHWGVYSALAGEWNGVGSLGYSEHIMRSRKIPLKDYKEKVVASFDPTKFNADTWMRTAKETGMKYFIVTAKHHDGFAMFPSKAYPYDIRLTKYTRDPMKELSDAAHKYGIKFGFYYSHAFDWEHPDAPGNDWDYNNPGGDKLLHGANWWESFPEFLPNAEKYVNEKSIPQILELIANYHPDILWFDTPHKLPIYLNLKIIQAIRQADSTVVVNGRLARVGDVNFGDYKNTGDRAAYFRATKGIWEAIPTTNESYGYNKFDSSHKPASHFIRVLASAAAKGGNILLNVGPTGDGIMDPKDVAILKGVGKWMDKNSESIYGTSRNPLSIQSWGEITQKGNTLYLHIFQWPADGVLTVGGLNAKVLSATMLADAKHTALKTTQKNSTDLEIKVPAQMPDTINSVLKLELASKPVSCNDVRLVTDKMPVTLLVFDATPSGKSFAYGDGKRNNEYASNWVDTHQTLEWAFRTNRAVSFSIKLAYNTEKKDQNGTVELDIDGNRFPLPYTASTKGDSYIELTVDKTVNVSSGNHKIKLSLVDFTGKQAMRPLFVTLSPVK